MNIRLGIFRFLILAPVLFFVGAGTDAVEYVELDNGVQLEMSLVSAGSATLGSEAGEHGRSKDEAPRKIRITQDFLISITPITRGHFTHFVAQTGYRTEAEVGTSGGWGFVAGSLVQRRDFTWRNPGFVQDDRHPVVLVTWNDAQAFCSWASKRTRRSVSLPTEAEWEYACRGGNEGTWNGPASASSNGTRAVGEDMANPLGLHDLLGQVNQWCQDWYHPVLIAEGATGGAVGIDPRMDSPFPGDTARRSLRGGSFLQITRQRPAARWRNAPATRNADNGFRVIVRPIAAVVISKSAELPVVGTALPSAEANEPAVEASSPTAPSRGAIQPNFQPTVTHSNGFEISGFMIFLIMAFIFIVIALLKKMFTSSNRNEVRRNAPVRRAAPNPNIELQSDGFWVDTSTLQPGERLSYRVCRDGQWQNDHVDVVNGTEGQFVYTGARPEQVVILGLAAAEAQGLMNRPPARQTRRTTDDFPSTNFSTTSSSTNFPSAY
jgi:formylglycine-generating enzyme required for sulfatase activity